MRTRRRLIRQERLRLLGELASGIVHDFDNSLAQILGFSELLLARPAELNDEARLREYVQLINTAASDAAQLVGRLRSLHGRSKSEDLRRPVGLNDLVEQAVALTRPQWNEQARARGITITVGTALRKAPSIPGDPTSLRELLINLLLNAIDALPHGGTITLRTRVGRERVILEVSDSGIGMTEQIRKRCLEPFFSTKGEHGSGLGLAMVNRIVRQHAATIEIVSALGKGTTIVVRLPTYPRGSHPGN